MERTWEGSGARPTAGPSKTWKLLCSCSPMQTFINMINQYQEQ